MTFDSHYYVPVLKVKRGEKSALGQIASSLRPRIIPLLEIVERQPDSAIEKHLETAFKGLAESVWGYSRCFLDARKLAPDGPRAAASVFGRAADEGITFTPVTRVTSTVDVGAAFEHGTNGSGYSDDAG